MVEICRVTPKNLNNSNHERLPKSEHFVQILEGQTSHVTIRSHSRSGFQASVLRTSAVNSNYTVVYLCFFITQPPTKWHYCDVIMHALHFWGQGRGLLVGWVSYLWLKKKGGEKGKVASTLRWNMDKQIDYETDTLPSELARLNIKYFILGLMLLFPSCSFFFSYR